MSVFTLLIAIGLSGCENLKDTLGLSRHAPDEFAVMQRAPLVVPQDLSALPLPNPGAPRPMETPATVQAKAALLGDAFNSSFSHESSNVESVLLQKAGASQTQSSIRSVVNRESKEEVKDNRPVIKRLMGLGSDERPATVVDPVAEAQRIQEAKKTGMPVTTGKTPTVQQ